MSREIRKPARVFAALGDRTRLGLVATLAEGRARSISQLTQGSRLTRQAIAKHLRVLERAGLVHCTPAGRERLYEFDHGPLKSAAEYLDLVSRQWDQRLARLKSLVEIR